jgi:general secretion pathway protein B
VTEVKTKETVRKPDTAKSRQTPKAAGIKKGLKTANSQTAEKNPASPVEQPSRTAAAVEALSDMQALTGGGTSAGKSAASQVQKWYELSQQIRDAIPDISVSMLIYSTKPGERWININGSKRREGDEISAGLKLDEITPDGAILNYRGRRFYKGVIGD